MAEARLTLRITRASDLVELLGPDDKRDYRWRSGPLAAGVVISNCSTSATGRKRFNLDSMDSITDECWSGTCLNWLDRRSGTFRTGMLWRGFRDEKMCHLKVSKQ